MESIYAITGWPTCAANSRSCCRSRCCSRRRSVRNIAYARSDATQDEIVAAAKAANIHDFIARLPEAYDTAVGERGLTLSGGERQRISLARAFLKDAPILILDEPTSAVDAGTEAAIVESLDRLITGRTSFIIAHRPSTIAHCDLIIHIEGGRLIDVGSAAAGFPGVGLDCGGG